MAYQVSHSTADEQILAEAAKNGEAATAAHYNFASWPRLLYCLKQQRGKQAVSDDPADQVLHWGCLSYDGSDEPEQIERAQTLLKENPDLASSSIHLAACAGDAKAVRAWLEKDPRSVNARGGIRDWEPLLYACYSRVALPQSDALAVVTLLLDHGADPNGHYLWGG